MLKALTVILSATAAFAANGDILERSSCVLPSYEQARDIGSYATSAEYQTAVADNRFVCEKLTYSSAGLPVIAYLYRPASWPAQPLPLVVYNRGSWVVNGQLPLLLTIFRRLAEAGFAVIAPMYRASEGAPGRDEMGGAEIADLLNVVPLAKQFAGIDSGNIFLYGASRGGVMCLLALREGFPARAAATFGAFTDLGTYLEQDTRAQQVLDTIWPDYTKEKLQIHETRSAVRWAERLNAPLLLMNGGADPQVSPSHAMNLAKRLEELRKPYQVHIFGGDGHSIYNHRVERDRLTVQWFQKHLKATGGP